MKFNIDAYSFNFFILIVFSFFFCTIIFFLNYLFICFNVYCSLFIFFENTAWMVPLLSIINMFSLWKNAPLFKENVFMKCLPFPSVEWEWVWMVCVWCCLQSLVKFIIVCFSLFRPNKCDLCFHLRIMHFVWIFYSVQEPHNFWHTRVCCRDLTKPI